jgi:UMF1 family MFS transporter
MATFLIANMVYTDALVALFAFGGIYAAGTFGWHTIQIGVFGILLACSGTLGAWLGGKLDDLLGPKKVIAGSMTILLAAIIVILSIYRDRLFFVLPVAAPVPGGGLCLAPADRITQYFGLFALSGKVTSFMAPLAVSLVTGITMSQKAGMAVLIVFFLTGLVLLMRVREQG